MRYGILFGFAALVLAACGVHGEGDGSSGDPPAPSGAGGGPFRVVGVGEYRLRTMYASDARCVEVVWYEGPARGPTTACDNDGDGWAEVAAKLPAGRYKITYRTQSGAAAWYGARDTVASMPAADKCFLYCTWWTGRQELTDLPKAQAHCAIEFSVGGDGHAFAIGNMANFR